MLRRSAVFFAMCLVLMSARAQETRYITDILQLGLFANADGTGEPIRNLVSGTEVNVLERVPNYARVRTTDGDEGWVKSAFLVVDKPAQLRVAEVEAENAELAGQTERARSAQIEAETRAEAIVARAESQLTELRSERAELANLETDNAAYLQRLEAYRGALPWPWVAAALVLALAAGFFAGYWWLDASIRRRHGGFRVY